MFPNTTFTGTGNATLNFNHLVNILHIGVQGASIGISLDNGITFLTLEVGSYSLNIGSLKYIEINGTGSWQVIGSFSEEGFSQI